MDFTMVSQLNTKALRQLLREHLNLKDEQVRESSQSIPTGGTAFITVTLSNSQPVGSTSFNYDGNREIEIISDSLNSLLSINAYGRNAYEMLINARVLLKTSEAKAAFKKLQVGVLNMSPVRDLTSVVGAGYESRALLELQLTHNHTIEFEQRRIAEVEIKTAH